MGLPIVLEDKQDLMRFLIRDLLYLWNDPGCQHCSGTFWNKGFTPGWPFVQDSSCFWPCLYRPSDSCHGEGLINMDAFFSRPWCNFRNSRDFFLRGLICSVGLQKLDLQPLPRLLLYIFYLRRWHLFIYFCHSLCHRSAEKSDGGG